MKKYIFGIIIFILSFNLLACRQRETSSLEAIENKGKIVMGTSGDFPPNEFHIMVDGKDKLVGFDIEIGKYIAEKLGVELEIKEMEFSNLLNSLGLGQIDMVIAGIGEEPDRDANFTISYEENGSHNSLLINAKNIGKFKSKADFKGARLAGQTGSLQKKLLSQFQDIEERELASVDALIMELKTEKIQGLIVSREAAESYCLANPDLAIASSIDLRSDDETGAAVALKTGNDELTDEINKIILEMKEKGLVEKWKKEAQALSNKTLN